MNTVVDTFTSPYQRDRLISAHKNPAAVPTVDTARMDSSERKRVDRLCKARDTYQAGKSLEEACKVAGLGQRRLQRLPTDQAVDLQRGLALAAKSRDEILAEVLVVLHQSAKEAGRRAPSLGLRIKGLRALGVPVRPPVLLENTLTADAPVVKVAIPIDEPFDLELAVKAGKTDFKFLRNSGG